MVDKLETKTKEGSLTVIGQTGDEGETGSTGPKGKPGDIGKRGPVGPHLIRDALVGLVSAVIIIGGPVTAAQIRSDLASIKKTQSEISTTQEAQEIRLDAQEKRVVLQNGKINELLDALADFIRHNASPTKPRR